MTDEGFFFPLMVMRLIIPPALSFSPTKIQASLESYLLVINKQMSADNAPLSQV